MEPFIGQIMPVGFSFPPRGWALCDGAILAISTNTALFSLLGTTFGGDGRTTFGLPDLRGRSIRHVGNGPGVDPISWGQRGGFNDRTLSVANLPSHTHTVSVGVSTDAGEEASPAGQVIASSAASFNEDPTSGQTLGGVSAGNTGGGAALNVDNPFLGLYVCIALVGIFPSRS